MEVAAANLTANSCSFDHVHFILTNGFAHSSLDKMSIKRSTVKRAAKKFALKGDMLYHIYKDNLCLVLKTRSEIESALRECHDDRSGGHRGVLITRKKLMMSYYWKTMTDDVKSWVGKCPQCQRTPQLRPLGLLSPVVPKLNLVKADASWDLVEIDLIGPFTTTTAGNNYIFTATDLFTKFVYARPIKRKSPGCVAAVIIDMIYAYGAPRRLLGCQGREFVNQLNEHVLDAFGIRRCVMSDYHGQDEAIEHSIAAIMEKYTNCEKTDWDLHVVPAAYSLNTSYQESIKTTPYKAMFTRNAHLAGTLSSVPGVSPGADHTRECEQTKVDHFLAAAKVLDKEVAENIALAERRWPLPSKCPTE